MPLCTPRLSLVAIAFEHAPAMFEYARDPEICSSAAWPRHENLADTRRFVSRSMVGYAEGGHYDWGVIRRGDEAFVGTCGFGALDASRGVAELGYVLARRYWGQGYATEAAAAVMRFGFVQLGLRVIEANAVPENVASLRVMAKLGMRYRENKLVTDPTTGASRLVYLWQLERQDWAGGRFAESP